MARFEDFDTRGYPMVDVRSGYGRWADTYEQTVEDVMDIALLNELTVPAWSSTRHALDLGCGTGRTGEWLRGRGVPAIDGVDLTPEMLALARARGAHHRLVEADVTGTGLPSGSYDLVVASLIDEHLPTLQPLYDEAWRLAAPGAVWVIAAFHPHFIMTTGMPTHFDDGAGEPVAIATHIHLISDHVGAGLRAGWRLVEMREGVVDDRWLALKKKWGPYRGHPVSYAMVWRRDG